MFLESSESYQKSRRRAKKPERSFSDVARVVAIATVIISALTLAVNIAMNEFFREDRVAERALAALAKDYYENYYFDRFSESTSDLSDAFEKYSTIGFPSVSLRQLLLVDNRRFAPYAYSFKNSRYACNQELTTVKIYPKSPYGKTDYDIKLNLSCSWLNS